MPRNENSRNRREETEDFEETPYLRRQRSIEVKRKQLEPSKLRIFWRVFWTVIFLLALGAGVKRFYDFATTGKPFQLSQLEIGELHHIPRSVVEEQLAPLMGQNIFRADYGERLRALTQMTWVESVVLMRYWPDKIAVTITERVPVGFALVGDQATLIDADGVPLEKMSDAMPAYDFPLMRGLAPENTVEDHEKNRSRIRRYGQLLKDLDSEQGEYSKDLSEVDVSDPEDVRILLQNDSVLIHLGKENFLVRFKLYLANIKRLKQEYPDIDSADLRFKDQIIIKRREAEKRADSK